MQKKFTHPPGIRVLGILLMFLLSLGIKAQTANNPVLTWDQEVGCIEYDDKGEKGDTATYVDLIENIDEGKCIRFCEDSYVNYTFTANNVQHVNWQPTGGNLQPGSNNTNATIIWGSSGNGNLTLTVTYTDNTVEVLSVCVEKILKPKAYFQIDSAQPDQNRFCVDTPISFDNLSTENNGSAIVSYLWDFGDGTYSNMFEPVHTYTNPGTYTVVLTVTNSCNCSDVYKKTIRITDEKVVDIICASVVCEKSTQTYSVNDGCGGEWKVTGGTIIANNGTSIQVVWDQVDPSDGFGYVSYLSKCSCPFWNTVKIPVILKEAKIKGPDVFCQGKQGRYSLPQWPTTDFTWEIDGDPYHQMLVLTDQRNEIVVDGMAPGIYTLGVRYRNTLIDGGTCEGRAKIQFEVVENVEIKTDLPLTVCTNTNKVFSTTTGISVTWEVTLGGNVVHTEYGPFMSYDFPNGGAHVITANNNGCISEPVVIEVIEKPVITGSISGPDKVCLSVPYTYQISENEPGAIYVWSMHSGSGAVVGSNAGTQADFTFASPTATIKVVKQYVKNGVTCESDPVYFDVSQIVVNGNIINNSGQSEFCPSSTSTFTANLNGMDVDHIEWKIVGTSSTGTTNNFGSIVSGINDLNVTVGFNEISNGVDTGELQLYVTKCSETKLFTYPIKLINMPSITLDIIPNGICPSSNTIEIVVTTSNGLSVVNGNQVAVQVSYDGGPFSTTSYPFTSGVPFNINNEFTNNTGNNIAKTLTVRLVNMCAFTPSASKTVTIYPLTKIDITPGYNYTVCPNNPYDITLYANISTGVTPSVTYNWYKVGIPNPIQSGASNQYNISNATQGLTPGGEYYVVVTDENLCVVTSEKVKVFESCGNGGTGPGGNCTGPIDPDASMTASWSSCGEITGFVYSPNYTPTSIHWVGSPHLTLNPATQNTPNGVFTTTVPGVHIVEAYITYNDCTILKTFTVIKYYEPKVKAAITCTGSGNYTVKLLNNSTIFGLNLSDIKFTFSGPGITNPTVGDTYTLNGVSPGTYTYVMEMYTPSNPSNPTCTVPITITIDPNPVTTFNLAAAYCSDETVALNIPGTMQPGYEYRWIFNGTSYVASNNATDVNFDLPANVATYDFPITLQITNQYGCVFTSSSIAKVNQAVFDGSVNPSTGEYCEGSVPSLNFIPVGPGPADIIWMRDNVQVGTGLTYTPTQSGSYWPILLDGNNCKNYDLVDTPAIIKVNKPPFASISGSTSVCYNEDVLLYGVFTDPNPALEHSWSGPNLPGGYGNWVTGATNIALNISGMPPGSYDYTFYTRLATDPTCEGKFTVTVVVHPQVATPVISYTVTKCQPYTLLLTASGPNVGTYNWSNGMIGQSIEVTQGGAYSVTYTAPTGCSATGYIQAPHNPERALWVVPSGCYTMCLNQGEYLLGPLGIYEGYEWTINGGTTQSGNNTFIPNQPITMAGYYQLNVTQMGCTFSSNTPHITANSDCDVNPCKFEVYIRDIYPVDGGYYAMSLYITNPYGYPITINISSQNGYGTYSPSTVTLNPGGNSFYPVYFYPNSSYYPGAADGMVIQAPDCISVVDFQFPKEIYPKAAAEIIEPELVLAPNPAFETTTASYNLGTQYQNAQSITVYDVTGVQRYKQKVNGIKGEVVINISNLAAGTYIINLEADGKVIKQQKLIKK